VVLDILIQKSYCAFKMLFCNNGLFVSLRMVSLKNVCLYVTGLTNGGTLGWGYLFWSTNGNVCVFGGGVGCLVVGETCLLLLQVK